MTTSLREQLLGYLLGALDDAEQESLEARLKDDPQCQRELATLRGRLKPVEAIREDFAFDPPPGLAERTCRWVALRVKSAAAVRSRPAALSPQVAPPANASGFRWHDLAVAATVLVATLSLTAPAIQHSRFYSRLVGCQNNLFQVGQAMKQHAWQHNDYFPCVRVQDTSAVAGNYATTLLDEKLLPDTSRLICPASSLANQGEIRLPSSAKLRFASPRDLDRLSRIYSCTVGYRRNGVYHDTRDLQRPYFALVSDPPADNRPGYQSDNHGGRGQNVLFEDGHVEFLTSPRSQARADDIYSNDEGFRAPGTHRNDSVIVPSGTPIIWTSN